MTPEQKKIAYTAGAAAAVVGVIGAIIFWPKTAKAQAMPASRKAEKVINMPDGNGASLSIPLNGLVWVNFLNKLPPGYQWAVSFAGDFVADIQRSNTGNWVEGLPVYTVTPRGKGNDKITFTAYKYNADGSPSTEKAPVYMVSFNLNVF